MRSAYFGPSGTLGFEIQYLSEAESYTVGK
jgi:hypothetical protein